MLLFLLELNWSLFQVWQEQVFRRFIYATDNCTVLFTNPSLPATCSNFWWKSSEVCWERVGRYEVSQCWVWSLVYPALNCPLGLHFPTENHGFNPNIYPVLFCLVTVSKFWNEDDMTESIPVVSYNVWLSRTSKQGKEKTGLKWNVEKEPYLSNCSIAAPILHINGKRRSLSIRPDQK